MPKGRRGEKQPADGDIVDLIDAGPDAGKSGRSDRGVAPETLIEQERRHIAAFQLIIEKQEAIIKRLDALGKSSIPAAVCGGDFEAVRRGATITARVRRCLAPCERPGWRLTSSRPVNE